MLSSQWGEFVRQVVRKRPTRQRRSGATGGSALPVSGVNWCRMLHGNAPLCRLARLVASDEKRLPVIGGRAGNRPFVSASLPESLLPARRLDRPLTRELVLVILAPCL